MLDLLRRVAVLTIISAVGIGFLAPLTARSALPGVATTDALLAAADAPVVVTPDRGGSPGRESSALLSLSTVLEPVGAEALTPPRALPTPPAALMQATLMPLPAAPAESQSATPAPSLAPATPTPRPTPVGETFTGAATWYCCSLGWRGEAVVALPGPLGGQYDAPPASTFVTVCAERCVSLPVVDYCECHWGTADEKVADLSPEAWAAVSDEPLSAGVITVTVQLGG